MNQQQIEQAKKIISETKVLSSLERAEWLQLLPSMSDQQLSDLMRILSQAAGEPKAPPVQQSQHFAPMPKIDISQKEISTSIPFYEKELPAHASAPASAPAPAPKPVAPAAPVQPVHPIPSVSQILQNHPVAQKAAGLPQMPVMPPKNLDPTHAILQSMHAPAPAPSMSAHSAPSAAAPLAALSTLSFHSPEDFSRLTVDNLHGKDPREIFKNILNSANQFASSGKILPVIVGIEKSPLYRSYIEYGLALLNGSTIQSALTKEQFEAFADFRKELDKIVM